MHDDAWDKKYRLALRDCIYRYNRMALEGNHSLVRFIAEFVLHLDDYPLTKLNRWLGYIQGVLICSGQTTVEAERDWTRSLLRPLDFEE